RETLLESFVISEDEHLVLDNRTAERSAKLIPLEWRGIGLSVAVSISVVEEVPGIECAVAEVLKGRTMPLIRSRSCHHRDLAAGAFAILGAVGFSQHVVFTNGIHAESLLAGSVRSDVLAGGIDSDALHNHHRQPIR